MLQSIAWQMCRATLPVGLAIALCMSVPSGAQGAQVASAGRTIMLNKHCRAVAERLSIPPDKVPTFVTGCVVAKGELNSEADTETDTDDAAFWLDVLGYAFVAFLSFGWGYSAGRARKYTALRREHSAPDV